MSRYLLLLAFLSFTSLALGQRNGNTAGNSHQESRPIHAVCENDFSDILQEMDQMRGQSSKLKVALASTEEYYFTTDQVFVLMKRLGWDSDKVKLGKKAYVKTVDPGNHGRLSQAFGLRSYYKVFCHWVTDYDAKTAALRTLHCKRSVLSPLPNGEFAQVKCAMDKQRSQGLKTQFAVEAINMNYVTSDQVMELMRKLSWDSDRLKVAKAAYVKTLDFENFLAVGEAFYYRSYERALQKYMLNYESFRAA